MSRSCLLLGDLGVLAGVDRERVVVLANLSDESLGVKISDDSSGHGTVDLELVAQFGHRDGEELGRILDDSIVGFLVEEDRVVKLFLYLDLGPALLLGLSAAGLLAGEGSGLGGLTLGALIVLLIDFLGLKRVRTAHIPYLYI